jgi:hypothetical protein
MIQQHLLRVLLLLLLYCCAVVCGGMGMQPPISGLPKSPPQLSDEAMSARIGDSNPTVPASSAALIRIKGVDGERYLCRDVPGYGSCLYHAVTAGIVHRQLGEHANFNNNNVYKLASLLRQISVDTLANSNDTLYIQDDIEVSAGDLASAAGAFYNISGTDYCSSMVHAQTWGGGPEIVALCNYLRCPIHVYELVSSGFLWRKKFKVRLLSAFGSPQFDRYKEPLCILSADCRFPHIRPGSQNAQGDHFFSLSKDMAQVKRRNGWRQRLARRLFRSKWFRR